MKQETKFKDTEIGKIPEDWEVDKIENYLDKIIDYRGKTPKKSESGVITISAKSIKNGKIDYNQTYFISEETFKKWEVRGKPHVGDILLTTEGPLGEVASYDREDVAIAQRLITLRGKDGKLDNNFLKYYLMSHIGQHQLHLRATGTTVQGIKQSEFRKTLILITTIKEQTAIAKILSDLDSKIELLQKQNKTLEAIAQALFKHWFVDFEFPNEEGKPYKSSGGEMVFNEELGKEIPKGWETDSLRYTIDYYIGGGWGEETKKNDFEIEAFVIRGTDIPSVKEGNVKNIPLRYHKKSNYEKRVLKNKDIVLEISGGSKGQPVGRSFLVNDIILKQLNDKAICASFCKLMRVKDKFSPFYISLLLDKIYENEDIMKYQLQSTGISNFNFEYFLDDVKILKIPNYIIIKFNEISERIFNKKNQNGYEANTLSKTRDLLLPKLMSGKIRVPVEVK